MQMSSAMAPTPLTTPNPNPNSSGNNNNNSNSNNNNSSSSGNPPSSSSMRSPPATLTSSLSLGLLSLPPSSSTQASHHHHHHHRSTQSVSDHHQHHLHHQHQHQHQHQHHAIEPEPIATAHPSAEPIMSAVASLPRIRLSDIMAYDGAPVGTYIRAAEALSGSLTRHNAAVIELSNDESALMRCALESTKLYFRTRALAGGGSNVGGTWGKPNRGVYMYRAGRALGDTDSSPPCMADAFRCMGKAARAALGAIAKHLRLRSDVFNHLLDDTPLPANETSSSVLVATYSHTSLQNGKGVIGIGKPSMNGEAEKGLLTLIVSDSPGLQVYDPNNRWYLADGGSGPGDLLLLTGRALGHVTAGIRRAAIYRAVPDYSSGTTGSGRTSLTFRLMPQGNAVLDCKPISAAGHVIPQSYVPITVSQFMDDLSAEEDVVGNNSDNTYDARSNLIREPSLRSVLSDPLSGSFLEDAMVVSCGHSFGGLMLRKVIEMLRCSICNAEIEGGSLIPNFALRAAAAAVKHEDDRRLFHNAALRKRRKEVGEQMYTLKRLNRENGEMPADGDNSMQHRGVQYPFSVNEKVVIKGNRRTPEKFVGREAVITSQCLNGWYLLKILGTGESVRLQYRSLRKISSSQSNDDRRPSQPVQNSS